MGKMVYTVIFQVHESKWTKRSTSLSSQFIILIAGYILSFIVFVSEKIIRFHRALRVVVVWIINFDFPLNKLICPLTNVSDSVLKNTEKSLMSCLGLECISFAKSIMGFLLRQLRTKNPFAFDKAFRNTISSNFTRQTIKPRKQGVYEMLDYLRAYL